MASSSSDDVLKIGSFQYLHVLDTNLNTVKVEVGPKTFTRLEHEKVVFGPEKMIVVPPRHFVVIANPVWRGKDGKEEYDEHGQVRLKHGDAEVRFEQEPFALFPGEKISGGIQPLQVVAENTALRLRAKRDFVDRYAKDAQGRPVKRRAGEEWIFAGLATYFPQSEEEVMQLTKAWIIKPNQALKLRAKEDCIDYMGVPRKAGEMWLVKRVGAYLPAVNEKEVGDGLVDAIVLSQKTALYLRASLAFTDSNGNERKPGEEWLLTSEDATYGDAYIPDVHEVVCARVPLTVLSHRQWCIIDNPVDEVTGKSLLGEQKYVRGPATFFLRPGETFKVEPSSVVVLAPNRALWVRAVEAFVDHTGKSRSAGDKWLVYGPGEYWPPAQVETQNQVRAFLEIDAAGLYFFQPAPFAVTIFLILLALFVIMRFMSVRSTNSTNAATNAAKAAAPKTDL